MQVVRPDIRCPLCNEADPIGPVRILTVRRKLKLDQIDLESAKQTKDEQMLAATREQFATTAKQAAKITQTSLAVAGRLVERASKAVMDGSVGDDVLQSLSLAFAVFAELELPVRCAEVGHLIAAAFTERGLSASPISNLADLSDLHYALDWYVFMDSREHVAMAHANIGRCAARVLPTDCDIRTYAAFAKLARLELFEARQAYEGIEQVASSQSILARIDLLREELESSIQAWGRVAASENIQAGLVKQGELHADATVKQGQFIRQGLVEQGEEMGAAIREAGGLMSGAVRHHGDALQAGFGSLGRSIESGSRAIGSGIESAGAKIGFGLGMGLNSLGQDLRRGIENAGNTLGSRVGQLAFGTAASVLGGSLIHGKLLGDSVRSIGPSLAGAVIQGGESVTNALKGLPSVISGEAPPGDFTTIISMPRSLDG